MPRTLAAHLMAWAMGTLLLVWAAFVVLGYQAGQEEADELTDGHLVSVTALMFAQDAGTAVAQAPAAPGRPGLKAHDYQQSLNVVTWNRQGELIRRVGSGPLPPFDRAEGFAIMELGDPPAPWRTFSRWSADGERQVVVTVSEAERDALADDIAQQISLPGWWLLPVMLLGLGWAVHRGLQPLRQLSGEIDRLDIQDPRPLSAKPRQQELRAAVDAINLLVRRYHAALTRERQLSNAFAHELRTPLTALGLQVQNLRSAGGTVDDAALRAIEHEARRASDVLSHLLSLARAGRAELVEAAVAVDVVPIARQVLAEHAPAAIAHGFELALSGDESLVVNGHPVLIEMAVRNLIENALVHTPQDSEVEVQINREAAWLQVCDGPRNKPHAPGGAPEPASPQYRNTSLGLGLGHQVVSRVAEVHAGRFGQVEPPPGFSRCYRIVFGAGDTAPSAPGPGPALDAEPGTVRL